MLPRKCLQLLQIIPLDGFAINGEIFVPEPEQGSQSNQNPAGIFGSSWQGLARSIVLHRCPGTSSGFISVSVPREGRDAGSRIRIAKQLVKVCLCFRWFHSNPKLTPFHLTSLRRVPARKARVWAETSD